MGRTTTVRLGGGQATVGDPELSVESAHCVGRAVPAEVGRLRTAVGAFACRCGASVALVDDVRLAVSEALSNAVMHAYPGAAGGRLEVRPNAVPASGLMMIRVRDHGIGCRPRDDSPRVGLGLPLMTALSRTINVASPADGGTEVQLTFALLAACRQRRAFRTASMLPRSAAAVPIRL